ncbi:MAG: hypothetical protein JNM00_07150, partial [Flavobacteriales bacterium]|nr:hypothetical protein [Flavobacteriales bacterium]
MKRSITLLSTLLFLISACAPQTAMPSLESTATTEEPTPDLGGIIVNDQSLLWSELRETRFGFGLAIPCWWIVEGMPPEGDVSTMSIQNFDDIFFNEYSENGEWIGGVPPQGVMYMEITAAITDATLTDEQAYLKYVDPATTELAASQPRKFGANTFTVLTLRNKQIQNAGLSVYVTRLDPQTILSFVSYPPSTIL